MKKKVVFVGTRPIMPMKDGRTVLINQYCTQLVEYMEYEVYYVCFGLGTEKQPDYLKKIFTINEPKILEIGKNLIFHTLLLQQWPMQTSLMYSHKSHKKLKKIVDEINPDIIIFDMARLTPYLKGIDATHCKKILDMDDLLSKRYYRQAQTNDLDGRVLGQFANKLPRVLVSTISKINLFQKLLKFEAKLMKKYELKVVNYYDKTFFCSPVDMEEFNNTSKIKAECVKVAVDLNYFNNTEELEERYKKQIIYLGNIDIAANMDTLMCLVKNIMPKLLGRDNGYKLLVIGKCSSQSYEKFKNYKFINFTFHVEDIREYLRKGIALVAPIQYGSGIKIKILEAMAFGIPVITSKYGTEGLDIKNGEQIIECEEIEEYVNEIIRVSNDEKYRKILIEKGRNYVEKNHSLKVCRDDLNIVLKK